MVDAMPAVKLHAWEPAARGRVNATRRRELAALWRFQARGAAEAAANIFHAKQQQKLSGVRWLLKSIWAYTHIVGGVRVALLLFSLLFFWHALQLTRDVWVCYWVRSSTQTIFNADQLIYASLALGAELLALGYSVVIAMSAVEGARRAFLSLASAFLHAPLVFFDRLVLEAADPDRRKLALPEDVSLNELTLAMISLTWTPDFRLQLVLF
ncbi:LOW QUALITY PROTEIN: ABC transporter [Phytophthora megakarya]|uniref:ABC transporter n=1 Tax=Phytophthora megakarya TaxID=4795 RepID=A0A225VYI2_9STRA|nr:LOW QUALITY PROTEIN: ABC transporter [Phytophthora megakarya]